MIPRKSAGDLTKADILLYLTGSEEGNAEFTVDMTRLDLLESARCGLIHYLHPFSSWSSTPNLYHDPCSTPAQVIRIAFISIMSFQFLLLHFHASILVSTFHTPTDLLQN